MSIYQEIAFYCLRWARGKCGDLGRQAKRAGRADSAGMAAHNISLDRLTAALASNSQGKAPAGHAPSVRANCEISPKNAYCRSFRLTDDVKIGKLQLLKEERRTAISSFIAQKLKLVSIRFIEDTMRLVSAIGGLLLWGICLVAVLVPQTVRASIIYSGAEHITIDQYNSTIAIDLDESGTADFLFEYAASDTSSELTIDGELAAIGYFACEWLGPFHGPPSCISAAEKIGPDRLWLSSKDDGLLAGYYETWRGGRFVGEAGYIGVKFSDSETWHFGWILFQSNLQASQGMISGWAYESIPQEPIAAGAVPEPATFLLLGLASLALTTKRRA